ncbi:unannotated protein [freshwater metagenome]|uniref:Unannotated protein n=1 Tax=freshwater metagenome TaxID=449393 RepID=A0A6J7K7I9_9ZZZZ
MRRRLRSGSEETTLPKSVMVSPFTVISVTRFPSTFIRSIGDSISMEPPRSSMALVIFSHIWPGP